jgi:hypothetical protein
MVSLLDIYNIKESSFSELKKDRNPARGNKGKTDAKDYYLVDEPADSETGSVKSKVVYKRSFGKMVADLEAEAIDFKKLSDENSDDMVLYNLSEELKELYNKFRTHVRKKYPEEYKKIQEKEIDEANVTGTGASFSAGNSMTYATPFAFKKKRKKEN